MPALQTESVELAYPAGLQSSVPAHSPCHACWPRPGSLPCQHGGAARSQSGAGGRGCPPEISQPPPSHLPAWKGHPGKCLGPARAHTASAISSLAIFKSKCHSCHQGSAFLFSAPSRPPTGVWRYMWETSPHTPELVTRTGMGTGTGGGHGCPSWGRQLRQEEERVGEGGAGGRIRSSHWAAKGGKFECAEAQAGLQRPPTWNSPVHLLWPLPAPPSLWTHRLLCLFSFANQFLGRVFSALSPIASLSASP